MIVFKIVPICPYIYRFLEKFIYGMVKNFLPYGFLLIGISLIITTYLSEVPVLNLFTFDFQILSIKSTSIACHFLLKLKFVIVFAISEELNNKR